MPKKVPSYARKFKDHKVMIISDNGSVTTYPVFNIDSGMIEIESEMLPESSAVKFYDNNYGGFTYVFNLPEIARVEAEQLKTLRRSTALKNMFSYERGKGLDLKTICLVGIAALAVIF